ncbi:MAG TPA: hypothetical protein VK157_13365 [Phycisphaerales bacterium]|nr:hypothetical protein [Phycisphaerales bacterium]
MRQLLVLAAMAGGVAGVAQGQIQVVMASRDHAPTGPLSLVPGTTDVRISNLQGIYRSAFTDKWNTVASIADPADASTLRDQMVILGQGLSFQSVAREGVTEIAPGEFIDLTSGLPQARFNDDGKWALAFTLQPSSAGQGRVVRWNGTSFDILARTGEAPSAGFPSYISTWGPTFSDAMIDNAGGVGFVATNFNPSDFGGGEAVFSSSGNAVLTRIFETIPTGQAGGATNFALDVDAGTYQADQNGTNWLWVGEVNTFSTEDKVLIRNGAVAIQEGSVIAGSGFTSPVSSISAAVMEPTGDWLVRGSNADGQTWVMYNGNVVARSNTPIFAGSSENWSSFVDMKADGRGNYVIAGNGNNPDGLINSVVVLNNQRVLVRESDGVDFTGDNTPDFFIGTFRDRCAFLQDGYFYFAFSLKTSASATANTPQNRVSLMRVRAVAGCDGIDFNNNGVFPEDQDVIDFFNVLAGAECSVCNDIDFNNNNVFPEDQDVIDFFNVLAGAECGG